MFSSQDIDMNTTLAKLYNWFPSLPQNVLVTIYKAQFKHMSLPMKNNISVDIRWLIKAKVQLARELSLKFVAYIGYGKRNYVRKWRTVRLLVSCNKCVRMQCYKKPYTSLGMMSNNKEDKIKFIRDGLNKESLDDIFLSFKTHLSGYVQHAISHLWPLFQKERARYSLRNMIVYNTVCQFIRKLDGKHILDPKRAFKPFLDIKPDEDVSHNHNYRYICFWFIVCIIVSNVMISIWLLFISFYCLLLND